MARSLSTAQLDPLIDAAVGRQLTPIEVKHFGFRFKATMRTRPRSEGSLCSASQIVAWFVPEPSAAPPGTVPGAIHVSRLPMEARDTVATQVYRSGPEALKAWRRGIETDPCEQVDPRLAFFAAENSDVAERALSVFHKVVELSRDAPASLNLDCGGGRPDCMGVLKALQPDMIESAADRCRGTSFPVAQQARCFSIALRTEQVNDHSHSSRTLRILVPEKPAGREIEVEKVKFIFSYAVA